MQDRPDRSEAPWARSPPTPSTASIRSTQLVASSKLAATRTAAASSATPRRRAPISLPRAARSSRRCTSPSRTRRPAGLVGAKLRAHRQRRIAPIVKRFRRWLAAVEPTLLPSEPLARGGRLLPAPRRRAVPIPRRSRCSDRQLAHRARVPVRRQAPPQHALRRQHRGRAPRLRAARHRRDLPRRRRPSPGLPDLGLRAPWDPPQRRRAAGRAAHARRVQARATERAGDRLAAQARPTTAVIPVSLIGHASVIASSHHHLPRRGVVASRLRDIQLPCLWAWVITSSRRARGARHVEKRALAELRFFAGRRGRPTRRRRRGGGRCPRSPPR
jgi:hypothetical protein